MQGASASRTKQDAPVRPQPVRVAVVRRPGADDLPYPSYATPGSAGADLCAALDAPLAIAMGEIHLVPTGLEIAIPDGFEGQIRPRSGLALRSGLTMVNSPGTIDSDYRGELKLIVTTLRREGCTIRRGDRIAQLVIVPVARAEFVPVPSLDATARGSGGFGHSGISAAASRAEDAGRSETADSTAADRRVAGHAPSGAGGTIP